jgi:hypothetical protein
MKRVVLALGLEEVTAAVPMVVAVILEVAIMDLVLGAQGAKGHLLSLTGLQNRKLKEGVPKAGRPFSLMANTQSTQVSRRARVNLNLDLAGLRTSSVSGHHLEMTGKTPHQIQGAECLRVYLGLPFQMHFVSLGGNPRGKEVLLRSL